MWFCWPLCFFPGNQPGSQYLRFSFDFSSQKVCSSYRLCLITRLVLLDFKVPYFWGGMGYGTGLINHFSTLTLTSVITDIHTYIHLRSLWRVSRAHMMRIYRTSKHNCCGSVVPLVRIWDAQSAHLGQFWCASTEPTVHLWGASIKILPNTHQKSSRYAPYAPLKSPRGADPEAS